MTIQYRKTTTDIVNPFGDARSNRANWRSPLDKRVIPAGFVYYWDEENSRLQDAGKRTGYLYNDDAKKLREILDKNSEPVEETIGNIITSFGWHTPLIVNVICEAKGITPAELRQILQDFEDSDKVSE